MRRALIVAGVLTAGYGVGSALLDDDVKLGGVVLFLAAVLVVHDLVLLPAVLGLGALLARFVPPRARAAVQAAGVVVLPVTLVALPLVLGYGRPPDNPSALPLPYGRGLLVVLAAVLAGGLAVHGLRRVLTRRPTPGR